MIHVDHYYIYNILENYKFLCMKLYLSMTYNNTGLWFHSLLQPSQLHVMYDDTIVSGLRSARKVKGFVVWCGQASTIGPYTTILTVARLHSMSRVTITKFQLSTMDCQISCQIER